ncbi:hypothetical protein [Nonomuraea recticatena]|uniref:hypothetical protein n=1 Tax=Nonomuraea recticatena TaxID=46178 RepID=UPI003615AEF5
MLVAETPRPGRAGELARRARVALVVVAPAPGVERGEDAAQRRLSEPAHRLGREFELAAPPQQVALLLQLTLDPLERLQVVDGRAAESTPYRGLVDVVEARAGVVLAEGGLQLGEVGQLLQGRHGVAHAHGVLARQPFGVPHARSGRRA